ncbi:MAG: RdgB/HAM1 family non-canonical purine NTP pyrophosphatase [bacterium]|nr:RdgB/HAM1 family non-canonical purine NTP pyrophosphatase [bacterium]
MSHPLVLATRNPGKLAELTRALAPLGPLGLQLLTEADFPAAPSPSETGSSYRENAALKAREWARRTGITALADDSGLEVAALGGAPGIDSAVYAGPGASDADNNRKLLDAMAGMADRRATFRCCLALAGPDGSVRYFEGSCEGIIADQPSGGWGFGYDPLFSVPGQGVTLAGLAPEAKDAVSHRGQALALLRKWLETILSRGGGTG